MKITEQMIDAAMEKIMPGMAVDRTDMKRALEAATADAWQPINTCPKLPHEQYQLSHAEKRWLRYGRWFSGEGAWYYSGTNERSQWSQVRGDEPTHWQPMPELPLKERGL